MNSGLVLASLETEKGVRDWIVRLQNCPWHGQWQNVTSQTQQHL